MKKGKSAIEIKKAIEIVQGLKIYYDNDCLLDEEEIEENKTVNNAIDTLINHITKQEKMIQLLIDDLQGEGCLKMAREEIDKYYEKIIKLQDNEI